MAIVNGKNVRNKTGIDQDSVIVVFSFNILVQDGQFNYHLSGKASNYTIKCLVDVIQLVVT